MSDNRNQAVISLQGVSKCFGRTKALDHVSLQVPSGVVFALLGENGAGKTTLIRILTGFLKPDGGSASVLGHSCTTSGQEIRRQIGYVSDAPALYEWMTAEEIGWFASAFYQPSFGDRYLELLAGFDVPLAVKLKHLSKGQRAKVALALATAHDPPLLILDELKRSTSIVTATLDDPSATLPLPPGQVLTESRHGKQIRWVVQNLPVDWQSHFHQDGGTVEWTSQTPTLEEVFVAICDSRAQRPEIDREGTHFPDILVSPS